MESRRWCDEIHRIEDSITPRDHEGHPAERDHAAVPVRPLCRVLYGVEALQGLGLENRYGRPAGPELRIASCLHRAERAPVIPRLGSSGKERRELWAAPSSAGSRPFG